MAKRSRVLLSLVLLLVGLKATTDFAVQRLPKKQPAEFNERPGNAFSFEMEVPDWLMHALGADPKSGSGILLVCEFGWFLFLWIVSLMNNIYSSFRIQTNLRWRCE